MEFLKRQCWIILFFVVLCPMAGHANDALKLGEQQIKAGLLYNFLKYTKWPDASTGTFPLTVCAYGDDPFNNALQPMQGRTVNQRAITIRAISEPGAIAGCHLLFINRSERESWPAIKSFVTGKPVLTVSDFDGFTASGGMIEFGHEANHIIAILDIAVTSAAGLKVEDRLLKLVTIVGEKP